MAGAEAEALRAAISLPAIAGAGAAVAASAALFVVGEFRGWSGWRDALTLAQFVVVCTAGVLYVTVVLFLRGFAL